MIVDLLCENCPLYYDDYFAQSVEDANTLPCPRCGETMTRRWTGVPGIVWKFAFTHKGVRQPYGFDVSANQYFDTAKQQQDWADRTGHEIMREPTM
jgi:hypothetical protein